MEWILIRHAQAAGNLERRFLGATDAPLTAEGERMALQTAARLSAVERVYRSPLLRCAQTAALLWPGAAETVAEELRETNFGVFEGKTHEALADDPRYRQWLSAPGSAPPGGESAAQAEARARRALEFLLADAKKRRLSRAGVVTHGGVLLTWMGRFGRPERKNFYDWRCGNCGGFRVLVREEPLLLEVRETI